MLFLLFQKKTFISVRYFKENLNLYTQTGSSPHTNSRAIGPRKMWVYGVTIFFFHIEVQYIILLTTTETLIITCIP